MLNIITEHFMHAISKQRFFFILFFGAVFLDERRKGVADGVDSFGQEYLNFFSKDSPTEKGNLSYKTGSI